MAAMSRKSRSDTEQRRELGGYTEAEFDREFVRSQRSDALSVAIRAVTLVVVYGLLARAIKSHDLPSWLLVLPFAVEFLVIFWLGWFLSRFVVSCPAFRKSAGSFGLVLFWSLLLAGGMGAAIVFNPGGEPAPAGAAALHDAWNWVVRTDMHWALLAMLAALIVGTAQEVMRWKQVGGVFVWTSIMTAGFRLGVAFLMAFFGIFVAVFAGEFIVDLADARLQFGGTVLNWVLFGFIVLVEVATVVVSVLMHRDAMNSKSEKVAAPAKPKRGVLP